MRDVSRAVTATDVIGEAVGLPRSGQQLLELLTAALSRDNDLARRRVPHQKPAHAGVAAEQRVPAPIGAASASGSSPSPLLQRASSRLSASSSVTAAMLP